MCTIWNIQLLGQKRKSRESNLGFSCLHSEVTHVTPPSFHCPEWVTEDWKYSYLTSITVYHILQQNSWEQCCQFFLTLEKLWRYRFVKKLSAILRSPSGSWRHFLFGILWLVCLWLLTPPQSVPSGISQICVSLVPHLPSPLSITNCRVIFSICPCIHFFSYPTFVKLFLGAFTCP